MPEVGDPLRLEPLDDRDLVFRLAEPAAVVIKGERAADLGGFLGQRPQLGGGRFDPALLLGPLTLSGPRSSKHPELGLDCVPLEQVEDDAATRD